ncbi:MAG: hypothetical protein ACREXT_10135, partial [Gammaproteobacteria bacterium]
SRGDLEDSLIAGATAGAFYQVGNLNVNWVEKSLAHGVVGGVSSTVRGGDFVSGFLSAGLVEASTTPLQALELDFGGNLIATSVIGRASCAS